MITIWKTKKKLKEEESKIDSSGRGDVNEHIPFDKFILFPLSFRNVLSKKSKQFLLLPFYRQRIPLPAPTKKKSNKILRFTNQLSDNLQTQLLSISFYYSSIYFSSFCSNLVQRLSVSFYNFTRCNIILKLKVVVGQNMKIKYSR